MSAIKICGRCGKKAPHHSDVDNICMQCEMDKYYPDDPIVSGLVGQLQSNAVMEDVLGRTEESLKKNIDTLKKLVNPFKF